MNDGVPLFLTNGIWYGLQAYKKLKFAYKFVFKTIHDRVDWHIWTYIYIIHKGK